MNESNHHFTVVGDSRPNDRPWGLMMWPPSPAIQLTGQVVELSRCVPDRDAEPLFRALDHDAVWRHLAGRSRDPEAYAAILEKRLAEGRFLWTVRLLRPFADMPAGSIVGTSSYLDVSAADARLEIGATAYTPSVWSTKVNCDTKLQLLAYAFDVLGAGRVQFKTDVRNHRSQRAIASLGASYEGTLRRHQRRGDGTVRDSAMFSIIAEQWPAVRERLIARLTAKAASP